MTNQSPSNIIKSVSHDTVFNGVLEINNLTGINLIFDSTNYITTQSLYERISGMCGKLYGCSAVATIDGDQRVSLNYPVFIGFSKALSNQTEYVYTDLLRKFDQSIHSFIATNGPEHYMVRFVNQPTRSCTLNSIKGEILNTLLLLDGVVAGCDVLVVNRLIERFNGQGKQVVLDEIVRQLKEYSIKQAFYFVRSQEDLDLFTQKLIENRLLANVYTIQDNDENKMAVDAKRLIY